MAHLLVARAGALGDFVLTLPVIEALRREGHRVDVACDPRYGRLLDGMPGSPGQILDVGGRGMAWAFGSGQPPTYDRAYTFSAAMAEGIGAAGIPVSGVGAIPRGPASDHFGSVLGPLAPRPALPRIYSEPAPEEDLVVFAPGAGGAEKWAPWSWWLEVEAGLLEAGVAVVWVAGPVEAGEVWPREAVHPDLAGLVSLAARCRGWVGPDSGPQHLATAVRRGVGRSPGQVYVWFGPTDPLVWAPPGATVVTGSTPASVVARGIAARGIAAATVTTP